MASARVASQLGALAFSVGLGVAVATGPGVASAEPSASGSPSKGTAGASASAPASPPEPGSAPGSSPAPPAPNASAQRVVSTLSTGSVSGPTPRLANGIPAFEGASATTQASVGGAGGAKVPIAPATSQPAAAADSATVARTEVASPITSHQSFTAAAAPVIGGRTAVLTPTGSLTTQLGAAGANTATTPALTGGQSLRSPTVVTAGLSALSAPTAAPARTAPARLTPTVVATAAPTAPSPPAQVPNTLDGVITRVLAAIVLPLVDNAPIGVTDNPIVSALLAFARRLGQAGDVGTQAGYYFYSINNTSHTLKLISLTDRKGLVNPIPKVGDTIAPGQKMLIRPENLLFYDNWADATFQAVDNPNITYQVHMEDPWDGGQFARCSSKGGACSVNRLDTSLLDPAGTTYTIGADQPQRQAAILQSLCVNGSAAACTFNSTQTQKTYTTERVVSTLVKNSSTIEQTYTIGFKDTVQVANSAEVMFKAGTKIFDIVTAEISARYQRTVTTSHEFSESYQVKIPPGQYGWITAQEPIYRDTGTFTITLGNTKWVLTGVYFDSPNPTSPSKATIHTDPTPPNQQSALELPPVTASSDANRAQQSRKTRRAA